jgi:hypothetical protein
MEGKGWEVPAILICWTLCICVFAWHIYPAMCQESPTLEIRDVKSAGYISFVTGGKQPTTEQKLVVISLTTTPDLDTYNVVSEGKVVGVMNVITDGMGFMLMREIPMTEFDIVPQSTAQPQLGAPERVTSIGRFKFVRTDSALAIKPVKVGDPVDD